MISRRKLLISAAKLGPLAAIPAAFSGSLWNARPPGSLGTFIFDATDDLLRTAPVARYWISTASAGVDCAKCHRPGETLDPKAHLGKPAIVQCRLCAQNCVLRPGERGKCRARINVKGELRSLVYGHPVAVHVDPIEKKPLYHFLPGADAFSFATSGCPLRCKFCQNWQISQSRPEDFDAVFVPPAEIVKSASSRRSPVIAFTYNEPTVFMEYLSDTARLARRQNLRCVLISCGFMNPEPLREMCQILDAIKIDLKGYSPDFYRNVCGADLQPVLNSIRQVAKSGIHLELVNLVVPTLNDSDKMLGGLVDWVAGEIGPDVPIHFTRFHPDYQLLHLPPTPVATLERARNLAISRGIRYAYVGNVPDHPGNHTYCPKCGRAVIRRSSIFMMELNLKEGRCQFCGTAIAGVWS
jgi:pyruvate formate lyase activating enzyme